jgi:hypothetical protein
MLCYTILYCSILYYILYYTIQYNTILYCTILYYIALILYYTMKEQCSTFHHAFCCRVKSRDFKYLVHCYTVNAPVGLQAHLLTGAFSCVR